MGKLVRNGVEYGGSGTVDKELSATSKNPVENQVITQVLEDIKSGKLDKIYIDTEANWNSPTSRKLNKGEVALVTDIKDHPLWGDFHDDTNPVAIFVATKDNAVVNYNTANGRYFIDDMTMSELVGAEIIKLQSQTLPNNGNHTTINGMDVYVSSTQPTGNIAEGSIGIGW